MRTRVVAIGEAGAAAEAASLLRDGGHAVIPTETVYGIAARADDAAALERVYEAKGRPREKAMALHLAHRDEVAGCAASLSEGARRLIDGLLPGPLMLLLRPSPAVPAAICSEGPRVGVRVPAHEGARSVLARVGHLVVATSANRSGRPAPGRLDEVVEEVDGRVDLIVYDPRPLLGVASTVLDLVARPPRILRQGAVARADLERLLGARIGAS